MENCPKKLQLMWLKCSMLVGGQCSVFGKELSSAVKLEFQRMLGLESPRIVAGKKLQ
jgi:hypothetical protein